MQIYSVSKRLSLESWKKDYEICCNTLGYGLWYTHTLDSTHTGYTDSDFAGGIDDRKITSSYAFHLGTNLISWASHKQPIVSMSYAKAKYVAATTPAFHAVWLRLLLKDIGHIAKDPTYIFF